MKNVPTPPRRFYPYLCEVDTSPIPESERLSVREVRTFGEATKFLLEILQVEFKGDLCPSLRTLLLSRALVETGVVTTDIALRERGYDTEQVLPRIMDEIGYLDSSFFQHWHHYRWHHTGRAIYDVHPALAKAFLETELTVAPQVLRLAYPTVYLGLLDLGLTVWHETTGEHPLNGMYVTCDDSRTGEPELLIVVVGEAQPGKPANDNALCSFSVPLDGSFVEERVSNLDANPTRAELLGRNSKRFALWARLAVNALLYIQHVTEDVVHERNYGVPPNKLAHANVIRSGRQREAYLSKYRADVRYVRLGGRFATDASAGGEREGALVRHLVRGHWRWQVCGKGRLERRLMWIRPHWRGDEQNETPSHPMTTIVEVYNESNDCCQ